MKFKEALRNFLECKTSALSDTESRWIAMTEKKERILAEISQHRVLCPYYELLLNMVVELVLL